MTRTLPASLFTLTAALLFAAWLALPVFADEPAAADETAASSADEPAAPPAHPSDPEQKELHKCIVTGLPWEASPTRVEAIFNLDGESLRGYFVSLAYMYMLRDSLVSDNHTVEIAQIKIIDYPTFGTDHEQMITVDKLGGNIHLILVDQALDGTKAPYILAYSNKDAAREAIDPNHGKFQGEYLPWDKAVQRILEALEVDPKAFEPSKAMGD